MMKKINVMLNPGVLNIENYKVRAVAAEKSRCIQSLNTAEGIWHTYIEVPK